MTNCKKGRTPLIFLTIRYAFMKLLPVGTQNVEVNTRTRSDKTVFRKEFHSLNLYLSQIVTNILFCTVLSDENVQSLPQKDSSTQCDLQLPPSNESILSCP